MIGDATGTILDHYTISGSGSQTAGTANNLTITMKDSAGNTIVGFTGDKNLTFNGANSIGSFNPTVTDKTGTAVPFGTATTITFTGGVATVTAGKNGAMTLYRAEAASITATDASSITTSPPLSVNVSPATAASFTASATSPETAGQAFTVSLTAKDSFGNTATSYTGTKAIDFAGPHNAPTARLPATRPR